MIELLNAGESADYEEFLVETDSQVYKVYFLKKFGVSSWICLKGAESKEEIKEILAKLDDLRIKMLTGDVMVVE
jgi:hypothetical protein